MFKRTLLIGALALAGTTIGAGAADAAKPDHKDFFTVDEGGLEEFVTDACGFTVEFTVHVNVRVRVFDGGERLAIHENGTFQLINPENGKTLTEDWAVNVKTVGIESMTEEGYVRIDYHDEVRGMPVRWRGPDGEILIFDHERLLAGEVWRAFSFLFFPAGAGTSATSLLFAFFGTMLLITFGDGLEAEWGSFRTSLYVYLGWATCLR